MDDLTKFHMINCKVVSTLVSFLAKLTKTMNPITLVDQLEMQDVIQRQESTCYSAWETTRWQGTWVIDTRCKANWITTIDKIYKVLWCTWLYSLPLWSNSSITFLKSQSVIWPKHSSSVWQQNASLPNFSFIFKQPLISREDE